MKYELHPLINLQINIGNQILLTYSFSLKLIVQLLSSLNQSRNFDCPNQLRATLTFFHNYDVTVLKQG